MNKLVKDADGPGWHEEPMVGLDLLNPLVPTADTAGSVTRVILAVFLAAVVR